MFPQSPTKGFEMSFNVFTLLQLAFFVAIVVNANLDSDAGESNASANNGSGKSIDVTFCETNCTEKDGEWSGCTGECICVHVDNCTEGRCMMLEGGDYEDYSTPEPEQ
ncbi:unnamed protein product [Ixodes pacificus]